MPQRIAFIDEMSTINKEVVHMGEMARIMVEKGVEAFLNGDEDLKKEVAILDKELYHQEQTIEKRCVDVIALYQPVAVDLRIVSTCLKIITDINRIGRYGRDIAEMAAHFDRDVHYKRAISITLMSQLALSMVSDAIDSFVKRDDVRARTLLDRDDEVDSLWDSVFRESLTYMMEDPRNITSGTHNILVARYLERIGDHSCNIGDRVIFMVTGIRLDPYERKKTKEKMHEEGTVEDMPTDGYYSAHLSEK